MRVFLEDVAPLEMNPLTLLLLLRVLFIHSNNLEQLKEIACQKRSALKDETCFKISPSVAPFVTASFVFIAFILFCFASLEQRPLVSRLI